MFAQPAPPEPVIGPPVRDNLPEFGSVAEDAQVRQFVNYDRLERLGWSEH